MTPGLTDHQVDRFARELLTAFDDRQTVPSLAARGTRLEWQDAYRVAGAAHRLRTARGERAVGRKIGFTNRNIWLQYGATSPIWAHVYDTTVVHADDGVAGIAADTLLRARIEPEIALRLSRPVPAHADITTVLACVDAVMPAFELVDCHFGDWKFTPAESAADFALHRWLVLGEPQTIEQMSAEAVEAALAHCTVTLRCNGTMQAQGIGKNALDHPALALAALADMLAADPDALPLSAGEIVSTGTLTDALPVTRGQLWTSHYEGLPSGGLELRLN